MDGSSGGSGGGLVMLLWLAIMVVVVAGGWKVFAKAGRPGWGILIPIYNVYLMIDIAGKPGWWLLLMFIPFVNIIITFVVCIAIAENFGKGIGFGIGLAIIPMVFYPILGFSDAKYMEKPAA